MTVLMLGNQQRNAQFNTSVRDLESTLNDIANNTSTGVYPLVDGVRCEVNAGNITFITDVTIKAGENNKCLFIGNAVQLLTSDTASSSYYGHAMIGKNVANATSFQDVSPKAYRSTGVGRTANFDTTQTYELPWGTTVKRAYYMNGRNPTYIRGLAYVYSSFANANSGGTTASSGASTVSLYAIQSKTTPLERTSRQTATAFRDSLELGPSSSSHSFVLPSGPITICLIGTGNRQAMIEVGNASGAVTAAVNYTVSAECGRP